jgi:hypothetical protein
MISVLKQNEWGQMRLGKLENRKEKREKKEFTQRTLRESTFAKYTQDKQSFAEKRAATPRGERASTLGKAEPRPVEDEVDCPAAAFDS